MSCSQPYFEVHVSGWAVHRARLLMGARSTWPLLGFASTKLVRLGGVLNDEGLKPSCCNCCIRMSDVFSLSSFLQIITWTWSGVNFLLGVGSAFCTARLLLANKPVVSLSK